MSRNRAAWIISEAGLRHLATAGIGLGWLRGWLLAAGAHEVNIHLLESESWRQEEADWQIFFADEAELASLTLPEGENFGLENPPRSGRYLRTEDGRQTLLLPLGDIAYDRQLYLSRLNAEPPHPLYVLFGDSGELALEPGLSASLEKPAAGWLNSEGMLIEEQVAEALRRKGLGFRSVESCTAGAIAARLGRLPGVSDVLDRAWVTYSNVAKCDEVGVDTGLIEVHGAVSEPVVRAMAAGGADAGHTCLAVSGIAGPEGSTADKPVGTVWMALALPGEEVISRSLRFAGSRSEIQSETVVTALAWLAELLG